MLFASCYVSLGGRFVPNEGDVAGYVYRIWRKYTAKWGVQLAGMIFQKHSSPQSSQYPIPLLSASVYLSDGLTRQYHEFQTS